MLTDGRKQGGDAMQECVSAYERMNSVPQQRCLLHGGYMKRHCMVCGGKMKFFGVSEQPIEPDAVFKLRWYKCTQCDYKEWVWCK